MQENPMVPDPLQTAEIINWWSSQRAFVDQASRQEAEKISARAAASISDLSTKELILPSKARADLESQVRSDLNVFNRRIARQLDEDLLQSLERVEGIEAFDSRTADAALAALGGVLGTGSIGLALIATSAATTVTASSAFFGLVSLGAVTTFSWPVFGAAACGAATLAVLSPRVIAAGTSRLKERYRKHVAALGYRSLVDGGRKSASTRERLLSALDAARDARLKGIK